MSDEGRRRRVAISGASGLVGSALAARLRALGHDVRPLVRRGPTDNADEIYWDPVAGDIESEKLEGLDAIVNLAGESIAAGRWTAKRKARIRDSRVLGTSLIAEALARMTDPPRVWVNASAIGFYGNRGDEPLDETSAPGTGFLAETTREWEAATAAAERAGVRVVKPRIGVVLAAAGGALARMLPAFRFGLGGRLGPGDQPMSWIALADVVGVMHFALTEPELKGPVNTVAPAPVTNAEFTRSLGRVLGRPTLFAVPEPLLRLALGEMGQELLLGGARVFPRALQNAGYTFRLPELACALRSELAGG